MVNRRASWVFASERFRHRERANDAVHEAFLRLYINGLDGIDNLRAWMIRAVTNFLIDHARREKRRGGTTDSLEWMAGPETSTGDLIQAEQHSMLHDALNSLRDTDREILRLLDPCILERLCWIASRG